MILKIDTEMIFETDSRGLIILFNMDYLYSTPATLFILTAIQFVPPFLSYIFRYQRPSELRQVDM
jgi:hypothetical protein